LVAIEADPKAVKVDSAGTATATESKTRLLRPAMAALVAAKSLGAALGFYGLASSVYSNVVARGNEVTQFGTAKNK
jgi:hypothetical protein